MRRWRHETRECRFATSGSTHSSNCNCDRLGSIAAALTSHATTRRTFILNKCGSPTAASRNLIETPPCVSTAMCSQIQVHRPVGHDPSGPVDDDHRYGSDRLRGMYSAFGCVPPLWINTLAAAAAGFRWNPLIASTNWPLMEDRASDPSSIAYARPSSMNAQRPNWPSELTAGIQLFSMVDALSFASSRRYPLISTTM